MLMAIPAHSQKHLMDVRTYLRELLDFEKDLTYVWVFLHLCNIHHNVTKKKYTDMWPWIMERFQKYRSQSIKNGSRYNRVV